MLVWNQFGSADVPLNSCNFGETKRERERERLSRILSFQRCLTGVIPDLGKLCFCDFSSQDLGAMRVMIESGKKQEAKLHKHDKHVQSSATIGCLQS